MSGNEAQLDKSTMKGVFWAGLGFVLINAVALAFEVYYLMALPLMALIAWAALTRLDSLLLFIVFCTPLSLNLEDLDLEGVGFYLPTEPLLAGVLVVFLFKVFSGKSIDRRIYTHPISWAIYFYLGWMLITCITSSMPVVSFKFLLTRLWYIVSFYFLAAHMFQHRGNLKKYMWLYLVPLAGVIVYTVIHHASYDFDKAAGHWVMSPFYKDHTSYGAVLAMYLPVAVGLVLLLRKRLMLSTFAFGLLTIVVIGLVLSYTRAAWVSVAAAGGLYMAMRLKIKFNHLLGTLVILGSFIYLSFDSLLINLERNESESSDNLAEHVESISNISSDASNLERLNRWDCAWQMFVERPFFGWGPGTYQFQYAPFQSSENLTIISTNSADGGNAHSEYLGPLAESGVLGTMSIIVLFYMVCQLGFRLYRRLPPGETRLMATCFFLGWFTYIVHGVLNNYLDTDKASIPFWGFIAAMVAIDLFYLGDTASQDSSVIDKA